MLQDGVPFNLADDNGDFQELDPQVVQHLEVYRGGNALRYGSSTLGGAINAVTPVGRTAPKLELRIDGGAFDTIRSKVAAGFFDERGDAYLALTTDNADGDRRHAQRNAVRFNGNAGLRLTENIETRFYASINHINQQLPGSLTLGQAVSTPALSLPNNISGDQHRDIDSLRLQNRTTIDWGTGKLVFGGFYNAKQLFHPIYQVIDQQSSDRGVFLNLDLAGNIGGLPWELTGGAQARFGAVAARQFVNVAGERGVLTSDARLIARTANSYGELRITPVPRLTLIAGAVYTNGLRKVNNHLTAPRSGRAVFNAISPKIGVLYGAANTSQIYANYSRSVELPGFIELNQVPSSGSPGFVNIAPQRAWTAEIGTRGSVGIATWDISFYRADVRGELLQFAVAADIPASTFNAGKTRHQGLEAGLTLSLASWATLQQVYQYNDFTFRDDVRYGDNRLPVVPKSQYRARLRLGTDRINLTPNIEWTPEGAYADYMNSVRAPGYVLFGLNAQARLRKGMKAFLDVRNLTARKAIGDISAVVSYSPDDPATALDESSAAFYPVERRAVYGGLRVQF